MALLIQKFGGTSLGDAERICAVAERIARAHRNGDSVVAVVSAMCGETDRLLSLVAEVVKQSDAREIDAVISTGEQVTTGLLAMALLDKGINARSFTGAAAGIETDNSHTKARITNISIAALRAAIKNGIIPVVAGFQGISVDGRVTTLGRGGSDTTAVALAAALNASECQIFTDVDGIYTTDPRVVNSARRLSRITFEEILEMASLGSKVLQIRAVEFAGRYRVPLRVLSSFADGEGTLITYEENGKMEKPEVSGVAFNRDEAKITVVNAPDKPGVARAIFGAVADAGIDVDMIIQNIGADGKTDLSFTVHRREFNHAMKAVRSAAAEVQAEAVRGARDIAKVSIVGIGMKSHAGVARRMFDALAEEGINIQMISTSEIKVSVVIDEKYLELSVRALHKAFALDRPPQKEKGSVAAAAKAKVASSAKKR